MTPHTNNVMNLNKFPIWSIFHVYNCYSRRHSSWIYIMKINSSTTLQEYKQLTKFGSTNLYLELSSLLCAKRSSQCAPNSSSQRGTPCFSLLLWQTRTWALKPYFIEWLKVNFSVGYGMRCSGYAMVICAKSYVLLFPWTPATWHV